MGVNFREWVGYIYKYFEADQKEFKQIKNNFIRINFWNLLEIGQPAKMRERWGGKPGLSSKNCWFRKEQFLKKLCEKHKKWKMDRLMHIHK